MEDNKNPAGGRLLVVEDEFIIAMHIESTLKSFGYAVSSASSGEEAIDKAVERPPDLVLMDIVLPGRIDGIDAAEKLMNRLGLPIVFLTSHADARTVERAKRIEPFGYVLKPFQETELATTVDLALRRHAAERRLERKQQSFWGLLESIRDGVILFDQNGRLVQMNSVAELATGWQAQRACGKTLNEVFAAAGEAVRNRLQSALETAVSKGAVIELLSETIFISANGKDRYIVDGVLPLLDGRREVTGAALIVRDVEDGWRIGLKPPAVSPRQAADEARALGPPGAALLSEDPVTGLPARARAEAAIAAAVERGGEVFAVPLVVERYDYLRQRFGQSVANELLVLYSVHLAQTAANEDQLFRWTGPSFLMLLRRHPCLEEVRREVARFASSRLEKTFDLNRRSAVLYFSACWTVIAVSGEDSPADLVRQIDSFTAAPWKTANQ